MSTQAPQKDVPCSTTAVTETGEMAELFDISRLEVATGSAIAGRYEVLRKLGAGAAGAVYSARDRASGLAVAVKILGDPTEKRANLVAKEELMYERLVRHGSPAINLFARILGGGLYGSLRFIAFELGSFTLLDVMNIPSLYPLPKRHLREIASQLLSGLRYMHSLSIVHADLKPNNIVLRSSDVVHVRRLGPDDKFVDKAELASVELFIIDLGEARLVSDGDGRGRICAGSYRAPEVTIGIPWSYGVDAFAAGCVLAEVCMGGPLFHFTETDLERLALLERVLGSFPTSLARRAERKRPGTFAFGYPPKIKFPPPHGGTGNISELSVRKILTAMPLTRLIFDRDYLQLCDWLLDLDPLSREDVTECFALDFLVSQDDDFVNSECSAHVGE